METKANRNHYFSSIAIDLRSFVVLSETIFSYCSIFLKYHLFDRDVLVRLYMTQGFTRPSMDEQWYIAKQYFNHLLSRSFFQEVNEYAYGISGKMQTTAWPCSLCVTGRCSHPNSLFPNVKEKFRHVVLMNYDRSLDEKVPKPCLKQNAKNDIDWKLYSRTC